ncbi:hypothetical protein [Sphingobium algorifonticola]|uniref:Uncharacterized protein n=1 Tax=Sphingobium algorifonticola TaxID=2008318 RepID=A0A437J3G6_9SPHN|nr:hypothetical protein [Sphingobium algorifonticola]RVT38881.1 hypothetical protein ENE74_16960 [Sphingobium algorifonticola]
MKRGQALDDPEIAATAWAHYRRIMAWMAVCAIGCVGLAIAALWYWTGPMPLHMIIATAIGVFFTFMLGTGLMGLLFLSSGTGHDEQVEDRMKGMIDIDD